MLTCTHCGGTSPDSALFCADCGAPLDAPCPSCGSAVAAGKRFCSQCGTALTSHGSVPTQGAPPAPERRTAERRVCSVLFCDLVGFTPLSESRDAEDVRELLSRYFDIARTVISRYGGVVEKFIGDAVMAVWGTPVALEGDSERAVRAALDLVEAVSALGVDIGATSLSARAGVVTGEVAVTLGATNEGMVAGDAVNTAARVQSVAAARTVLVDETTKRLAQAGVAFEDAGEHELKGKAAAQRLWRAAWVLSGVGGVQRVDGLEAPLTGRNVELRLVKELFHASIDRRQPRFALLSGLAGVGKSRLGWEFEKYVDGLAALTRWHRGRCLSYGDGVAFWALAEIVRQRLEIAEEDPVDTAADKLLTGVERYVTDEQERGYIGVRLGRLLGLSYPGDTGQDMPRDELFAGWRLWFERLAATHPVILLVEDLHYADAGLLEFIDHLVDWARDVPIFVLGFSRPDLELTRPGWGRGRNRTLLALDPLDSGSMMSLLDSLVPGMPADAADAIAQHAQGIPLFAVETVRSLIDRDVVVPRDGVYRLVTDVGTLTVPDSLHGLLAARLDALDPTARAVVADAAVLGSSFPAEALLAVSTLPAEPARRALDELVRREVLEISADPLSPQRGTYRFSHEMLRQVAYDTLSRRDRKVRHLAVAAHLRVAFPGDGEEVVEVLAQHYLDGLEAVPDDADADAVRVEAVAALTRAGERAERTGAPGRAAVSFVKAADLLEASGDSGSALVAAGLVERAADGAFGAGESDAVVSYADRASAAFRQLGQPRSAARVQVIAGRSQRMSGRMADARARLQGAIEVLITDPDESTLRALDHLGSVETFAGTPQADAATDHAVRLAQEIGAGPADLAGAFTTRGIYLGQAGRRPEAAALLREAAGLAEQAGASTAQGIALLNLADNIAPLDPTGAADAALGSAALLRRAGYRSYLVYALMNFVQASLMKGDWQAADVTLTETVESDGVEDAEEIAFGRAVLAAMHGDSAAATEYCTHITARRESEGPQEQSFGELADAWAAYSRGDIAEAHHHARRVLAHVDTLGISDDLPRWAWPLAARAAHELGDHTGTVELLATLDAEHPGHLVPMLVAERDLCRARLAADTGTEGAAGLFRAAITSLRERSTPYHLAQGLLDYADFLRVDDPQAGAAAIDEAQVIAERLGAGGVVRRAEALRDQKTYVASS